MREFKPSKKGIILYNGKEYRIKTDDVTISMLAFTCVGKIESIKNDIELLSIKANNNEIDIDTFVDEVGTQVDNILTHSERFCRLALGQEQYGEIKDSVCLMYDDVVELVGIIMQELTDIKNDKNKKLKESVVNRD